MLKMVLSHNRFLVRLILTINHWNTQMKFKIIVFQTTKIILKVKILMLNQKGQAHIYATVISLWI